MGDVMENNNRLFWRVKPIKEFDLKQTMYSFVKNENKNDMNLYATEFMGNNMTYKELFASADKLANALVYHGVNEGDNVSILTISMPLVQQCLLALSKIGASMSWIDLRSKEKDLIKYINNTYCETLIVFEDMVPLIKSIIDETNVKRVIVSSPKDYLSPLVKILANMKDKKEGKKIVLPNDKRFIRFNYFINNRAINVMVKPVGFEKDRPSLIVQSSGSTGKPKQILHTEYNFNSAVQKMAYTDLPFYKGTTMHISVPPFIIYGLANSIYGSLAFTMKALMNPYVEDYTVCNDLGKFDISLAAPVHYRFMYDKLNKLNEEIDMLEKDSSSQTKKELRHKLNEMKRILNGLERVKVFVSGGDKISAPELIQMQQLFNKTIVNGYGNNECLGATIVSPMFASKPGSIGIPMDGINIKVVNPETNEELPPLNVGELYISADNLFVKYLNNEEETNKIKEIDILGNQWVKTGDLCYIDNDGYVIPKGRNRRLIKKEAFKISPDTIEEVINSVECVKECIVVGVDDKKSISVPMAFVVLKDNNLDFEIAKKQIEERCMEELPDYEVPSYYEQIEEIPYTKNDKQDFRMLENIGNEIVKGKLLVKKI